MIEAIKELLNKDPFEPFRISLTSGEGFDVRHPDLVAVGESVVHVLFPKSDRFAILRSNQIASVQAIEKAA